MRRLMLVVVAALLVAIISFPVFAEVPPDLIPVCIGRTGSITATVGMQMLPAALEVDLLLENRGAAPIRFDPFKTTLQTLEGSLAPWTAAQTKRAHRDYGGYFFAATMLGPIALVFMGVAQLNFNRYVDSRTFLAVEVPAGQTVRGSLFFPMPAKGGTRAALELGGLAFASGEPYRLIRLYCTLPKEASEVPVVAGFAPITVSLSASGTEGPAEVTVGTVEFAAQYTAVEMIVTNKAETEAEIFGAMVNATVTDGSGVSYSGQAVRSQFEDRVPAKNKAAVRLVFAPLPLPPQTSVATLIVPGIRYGVDTVDVKVELRF